MIAARVRETGRDTVASAVEGDCDRARLGLVVGPLPHFE